MVAGRVTQLDKHEVLPALFASWEALAQLTADLSEEQWRLPTALPGWDVHAVIAHVIGTESVLRGTAIPTPEVDVSTLGHVRNDTGAMNECWVRHLSDQPGPALRERLLAVTRARREVLTGMSD